MNKIKLLTRFVPDEIMIRLLYFYRMHKVLHLKNPVLFSEKLQWLKLYNKRINDPRNTIMVDKKSAKDYVAAIIGETYIIPSLGVYDCFDEIEFDKLPNRFVLKCNHDSGGLVICKDKHALNKVKAKEKIEKCLKANFYWHGREWPYNNIKPCIIAEQYIEDKEVGDLRDYKFFCFNGSVKCFKVDFDRFAGHKCIYYDRNKRPLPFSEAAFACENNVELELPKAIDKMVELAEKLSKEIPFVRVDFYCINEQIYFGEMTLCPASGFGRFTSDEWDRRLGNWLELPKD